VLEQVTLPVPALSRLTQNPDLDQTSVDEFLREHSFPMQEGSRTTFVYAGDADAVRFHHWVHGVTNSRSFDRHVDLDLWHLTLQLPEYARIEYKIEVSSKCESELIQDPLNPLLAHDPFGANSVCYGPGYRIPGWILPDPSAPAGAIETIDVASKAFGETRSLDIYSPAGFTPDRAYPCLIVHDGSDFVRYSDLRTVLDNLIHRGQIEPLIVALTTPGDRLREYAGDPRHAQFLTDEVVPRLQQEFAVEDKSARLGLMGASFGAVASLHAAWLCPSSFGRLLLQSGSFVASPTGQTKRGPEFRPVVAFTQLFRTSPRPVCEKIYLSCGQYESLARHNRELVPLLEAAGMEVLYTESRDGHNWENWRDRLGEGLAFLFPGTAYTSGSHGESSS
jgi:enterochelin esterase family protein